MINRDQYKIHGYSNNNIGLKNQVQERAVSGGMPSRSKIGVKMNQSTAKENDGVNMAFQLIKRELQKKDDRILELENQIANLDKKLKFLLQSKRTGNTSTEIKNKYNSIPLTMNQYNKIGDYNFQEMGLGGTAEKNNFQNNNLERNAFNGSVSNYNQFLSQQKLNYNSDSEKIVKRRISGNDNLENSHDNSILTYTNGYSGNKNEKSDVKNYLKEVKSKVSQDLFKKFIKNIKLLTAKNNSGLDRKKIIENVRLLFGEEYKSLYNKFEAIIGFKK